MRLSKYLRSGQDGLLMFKCPGCDTVHGIKVGAGSGPRWGYNGNAEAPTFEPSVRVTWREPTEEGWKMIEEQQPLTQGRRDYPGQDHCCHSFVREGKIQFLSDCTHHLAGQTVELGHFAEDELS